MLEAADKLLVDRADLSEEHFDSQLSLFTNSTRKWKKLNSSTDFLIISILYSLDINATKNYSYQKSSNHHLTIIFSEITLVKKEYYKTHA